MYVKEHERKQLEKLRASVSCGFYAFERNPQADKLTKIAAKKEELVSFRYLPWLNDDLHTTWLFRKLWKGQLRSLRMKRISKCASPSYACFLFS